MEILRHEKLENRIIPSFEMHSKIAPQQRQASAYPHGRLHTVHICIHEWIHGSTFSTLCSKSLFHTEIFQLFLKIYHPSCHLLTSQSKYNESRTLTTDGAKLERHLKQYHIGGQRKSTATCSNLICLYSNKRADYKVG